MDLALPCLTRLRLTLAHGSRRVALLGSAVLLSACGTIGASAGIGIPVVPGVSLGVGVGTGGVNAGISAARGPFGVGVGVNQRGQVTGAVGAGTSTSVGKARVGMGVGTGTVLYDPQRKGHEPSKPRDFAREKARVLGEQQ